jgi:hypothetical protein
MGTRTGTGSGTAGTSRTTRGTLVPHQRPTMRTGLELASPAERDTLRRRYADGLRDGTLPRLYCLQRLHELDAIEHAAVTGTEVAA